MIATRARAFLGATALLTASMSRPAAAQQDSMTAAVGPAAGTLVRAWRANRYASPPFVTGNMMRLSPDSLVLHSRRRGTPVAMPRDSISRLEIFNGREGRARNMRIGAGVGGAIGLAGGALFGAVLESLCDVGCRYGSRGNAVLGLALPAAAVGALTGAGIGALFPGRETWRQVPLR